MEQMIPPRINLNGTSRESLLTDYMAALDALRKAMEALGRIVPNGRDYQTMPDPQACSRAREAFGERQVALRKILDDIEEVAVAISDQADNRRSSTGGKP